jgi:dTDP-4-amino-4,6-dideoxygalactose transaminase
MELPFYRDAFGYLPHDFPEASAAFKRIISLPIYPRMSDKEVRRVTDSVGQIVEQYRKP